MCLLTYLLTYLLKCTKKNANRGDLTRNTANGGHQISILTFMLSKTICMPHVLAVCVKSRGCRSRKTRRIFRSSGLATASIHYAYPGRDTADRGGFVVGVSTRLTREVVTHHGTNPARRNTTYRIYDGR